MSPVAKVRDAGAWIDSILEGYARVGGVFVAFGPPGGDTYEAIDLGDPPASTDLNDGTQAYNLGLEFDVLATVDCVGVEWRVPDTVADPQGGPHAASVWDLTPTRLAYVEFTPVVGGKQQILFDTPVTLAPGSYRVGVYTNHYVFTAGPPTGLDSPSGNLVVVSGRLAAYNGGAATAPIPSDSTTANFHVSPLTTIP